MSKRKKVFIIDNSKQFLDFFEGLFFERQELGIDLIGTSVNYKNATLNHKEMVDTDLFVISAFLPDKMGLELISDIKEKWNPRAKIIVTVTANTRNLVDEALANGADDFLQKAFKPRVLVDKIHELLHMNADDYSDVAEEKVMNRKQSEPSVSPFDSSPTRKRNNNEIEYFEVEKEERKYDESDEKELYEKEEPDRKILDIFEGTGGKSLFQNLTAKINATDEKPNKVCVFTSPKSVGKTSLLINTAAVVKRESEYEPKVLIMDLNLIYPSVSLKLHQDDLTFGARDIFDLIEEVDDLTEDFVQKAVIVHEPSGIHILNTPYQSIRDVSRVTDKRILELIVSLREFYDLILIDTAGHVRDNTTVIPLTISDLNVVIMENELGSILQTQRFVDILQVLEKETDKKIVDNSIFIVNRYKDKNKVSVESIKRLLTDKDDVDISIPVIIPDEPQMTKYSNYGQLIVDGNLEITDKITELANVVYPLYIEGDDVISKPKKNKKETNQSIVGKLKNMLHKK